MSIFSSTKKTLLIPTEFESMIHMSLHISVAQVQVFECQNIGCKRKPKVVTS